jgi:hypothetical protein
MVKKEGIKSDKNEIELLPLKSDVVFRMVFGDRRHHNILRGFLYAALDIPAEEYATISI